MFRRNKIFVAVASPGRFRSTGTAYLVVKYRSDGTEPNTYSNPTKISS